MALISIIRFVALCVVSLFALIELAVGAAALSTPINWLTEYKSAAGLAVAIGVLTVLSVPAMVVLEYLRPGAFFTSSILVELSWLSILWVLWLAVGGQAVTAANKVFVPGCGYIDNTIDANCREISAIEAFGFINWIILLAYTVLILILSVVALNRGHQGVWNSSVAEAPFFSPGAASTAGGYAGKAEMGGMQTEAYGGAHTVGAGGYDAGAEPASVQAGTVHR
ncbi:hypothetical protein FB45DRAFT_936599 [Roridomyces roridus]|uniref:MARVEL domain-containing protein n=1 Tax=Roridomyces roridus TaxID=1738132 RepID=A0AAD7B194_9AGAR|nr:hypothetical protein FB45DRAFT_948015 [Roridomyces roridus]KAJ7615008.1 hypothetical protein FB45DRAFT_936599 [Roridomyces roridus]